MYCKLNYISIDLNTMITYHDVKSSDSRSRVCKYDTRSVLGWLQKISNDVQLTSTSLVGQALFNQLGLKSHFTKHVTQIVHLIFLGIVKRQLPRNHRGGVL